MGLGKSVTGSIALHLLLVSGLYVLAKDLFPNHTIAVKIHTPTAGSIISSASNSAPSPVSRTKKVERNKLAPTPAPISATQPIAAETSSIAAEGSPIATAIAGGTTGQVSRAAPALLNRNSFQQPEYTRTALAARYEASVVADIFVHQDGSVGDIKLDQPLLYDMEARLLHAIRSASFSPALNSDGQPIPARTRIRFKLVIPR